jgi:hypothetical protein
MNLTGIETEIDIAQDLDRPEALADPAKFENRRHRQPARVGGPPPLPTSREPAPGAGKQNEARARYASPDQ